MKETSLGNFRDGIEDDMIDDINDGELDAWACGGKWFRISSSRSSFLDKSSVTSKWRYTLLQYEGFDIWMYNSTLFIWLVIIRKTVCFFSLLFTFSLLFLCEQEGHVRKYFCRWRKNK